MVVFVVAYLMGLQHFFIGLILGLVNTFIVDYYVDTIKRGNQGDIVRGMVLLRKTFTNIIIALSICMCIRAIDYGLLTARLVDIPIEPFRFIIFYQIIYYGFSFLFKRKSKVQKGECD